MKIKFDVEKNIQLINQTLGLSHELLCSDVITAQLSRTRRFFNFYV